MPVVLTALLTLACGSEPKGKASPERIVLIVVDTLRADHVGAHGGPAATPNLDALAARGQTFEHALASYHQTSMSMGAIFTGLTPSVEAPGGRVVVWATGSFCGMARFRSHGDPCLPAALPTLAEDLGAAGYATLGVTGNPLLFRPYGYDQGFDVWREVGEIPTDKFRRLSSRTHAQSRTGEAINRGVAAVLRERPSDRFFLYVHYLDVHDWFLMGHTYAKGVVAFDRYLGEMLGQLEAEGLLEGAVVIVTADHGELLPGEQHPMRSRLHAGNPSYEGVLRVPLIVAPAALGDSSAPVRGEDLRGRIRALATRGVGASPGPAEPGEPAELFVSELRTQTYRGDGFKSVWPRQDTAPLLFDLARDPGETRDVAALHPEVVAAHRARIEALSEELRGHRPAPVEPLDGDAAERLRALGYLE